MCPLSISNFEILFKNKHSINSFRHFGRVVKATDLNFYLYQIISSTSVSFVSAGEC